MFGEYLEFLDGTFTHEVVDVCVSAERSMSFVIERGAKGGHAYENRAVWVWRFNGGRIVDALTVDVDRDAALEFWRSVTA